MFLDFYKLQEQPFSDTPDPRYNYLGPSHRETLASLFYGIETGRGFVALIAQPGMGKTTLLFHLLELLRNSARTAFLFQTQCDSHELLRYLLADLGIQATEKDAPWMHEQLQKLLVSEAAAGRRLVLFIDEAQNLSESALETVRLISDFETPQSKLIQIVFSGQPQLADKLASPALIQLRQRVSILSRLDPFTPAETEAYIGHRLRVAGYKGGSLFTSEARAMIAALSGGIPRNVNNLCFGALTLGYSLGRKKIDNQLVQEAANDLQLKPLLSEECDSREPAPAPATAIAQDVPVHSDAASEKSGSGVSALYIPLVAAVVSVVWLCFLFVGKPGSEKGTDQAPVATKTVDASRSVHRNRRHQLRINGTQSIQALPFPVTEIARSPLALSPDWPRSVQPRTVSNAAVNDRAYDLSVSSAPTVSLESPLEGLFESPKGNPGDKNNKLQSPDRKEFQNAVNELRPNEP